MCRKLENITKKCYLCKKKKKFIYFHIKNKKDETNFVLKRDPLEGKVIKTLTLILCDALMYCAIYSLYLFFFC